MRISLIDLGTNSVRLFLFDLLASGAVKEIYRTKEMVRLGDNLFETKRLDGKAYKRTVKAFKNFRKIINEYNVDIVRAVATSALREAEDRERLIKKVLDKTGIPLEVISGEQEAALIASGLTKELHFKEEPILFIDIGGGSTELSYYKSGKVQGSLSLKLGAARCQQLILGSVPPKKPKKAVAALRKEIHDQLENFCSHFPKCPYPYAVGSSGSIRALERICNVDTPNEEGKRFPTLFTDEFIEKIQMLDRAQIMQVGSIEEKRADLILSATIILNEILHYFDVSQVLATNFALKDGILIDILHKSTYQKYQFAKSSTESLLDRTEVF